MEKKRKTTIWVSDPLMREKENLKEGQSFSGRLADIAERYTAIIKNTELPELTDIQVSILSEVLLGSFLTPTKLKYVSEEVLDAATGTKEEKQTLSDKIKTWTPAEIIMFMETYGV